MERIAVLSVDIEVAVIGAGVVGLAVAAGLASRGHEVVILEAANAIGSVTSARNSEVIHAGIYYPAGSRKALLCCEGRVKLYEWCASHAVAHAKVGKLIVATTPSEVEALEGLRQRAALNGVELVPLTAQEAHSLEPQLACLGALHSPETGIIDSHGYMLSLLGVAEDHGGSLALSTPVLGGERTSDGLALRCGGQEPMVLTARTVINAAGLFAQSVTARIAGGHPSTIPRLHMAKGNYFSLSSGRSPFQRLIYPIPVNGGLGVHYTVDRAGRGRFGPDVEWLEGDDPETIDYAVDQTRGDAFYKAIRTYWPGLPDGALGSDYAGVRPKLLGPEGGSPDFVLHTPEDSGIEGLFTLYGIESPGLTASLALAGWVANQVGERG